MKDSEKIQIVRVCKQEITDFINILESVLEVPSVQLYPLYDALNSVKINNDNLEYQVHNLVIPFDNNKHIQPSELYAQLRFDMSVEIDIAKRKQGEDAYSKYSLALTIFGNKDGKEHSFCWHVDRDAGEKSEEIHPLYHMQYSNGHTYLHPNGETQEFDWGNSIYLDVPRITHYPMDLFIGLSFIVTNFYKKSTTEKLFADRQFAYRLNESSNRILKPYFCALANKWGDTSIVNLQNYKLLCPVLQ